MTELLTFLNKIHKHIKFRIQSRLMPVLLEQKAHLSFMCRRTPKTHGLPSPLIVSLTSYPARFAKLPLTLKCLLSQSIAADRIILWIAHSDKHALTPAILELQQSGLEIAYCEDLRSFKKIIPTLQKYPDSFIVTADDDLYYWSTWLQELVCNYNGDQKEVVCHRAHRIRLGADMLPLPYSQWEIETERLDNSVLNFPTSGAGALYPPHVFFSDVLQADKFNKLCPDADDIWLYWMMRLNDGIARKISRKRPLQLWHDTQDQALFHTNMEDGGNDRQIIAVKKAYGFPVIDHLQSRWLEESP